MGEKHMIIPIHAEKASDRTQHPFMIKKKKINKLRTEQNFPNMIKAI